MIALRHHASYNKGLAKNYSRKFGDMLQRIVGRKKIKINIVSKINA